MLVSVVIPTKNRPGAVLDAVNSVLQGSYQGFELFVVDQSTGDETEDLLRPVLRDTRVHYHRNRERAPGAGSSRNIGIALSNGDVIAVIDDDVTAYPDWLANMVGVFEGQPELDFLCGSLVAPERQSDDGFTPSFDPERGLTSWQLVFRAAGANLGLRRRLLERVGGYDEIFGPGCPLFVSDDTEIILRIVRSGARWESAPDVRVFHKHGFRPHADAERLIDGYNYGNGAAFGRALRRGDVWAALFFLAREARQACRGHVNLLRKPGRAAICSCLRDLRAVRLGLCGFFRALPIPLQVGQTPWSELQAIRRRHELTNESLLDGAAGELDQ